jgi:hypothetical protein
VVVDEDHPQRTRHGSTLSPAGPPVEGEWGRPGPP